MEHITPSKLEPKVEEILDDILDHTVYRDGDGPNASGGDWLHWKDGKSTPLKTQLLSLLKNSQLEARIDENEGWVEQALANYMEHDIPVVGLDEIKDRLSQLRLEKKKLEEDKE